MEAKEYKYEILTEEEKALLSQFGHHTIEAILIRETERRLKSLPLLTSSIRKIDVHA